MKFSNRRDAGRQLTDKLSAFKDTNTTVLAIPRGGVPVGFEVATRLNLPLDVFLVRKLGYPGHGEFAIGAIASSGSVVLNRALTQRLPAGYLNLIIEKEKAEIRRRELLYRGRRPLARLAGRRAILVDDGLATGSSMLAAILTLRKLKPQNIIVAVPVGSQQACATISAHVDKVVCLHTPENFHAVGLWYKDFSQTSDVEVKTLLAEARARQFAA